MKAVYFVFYKDGDYPCDRMNILYNRVNPKGIWRFINIFDQELYGVIPFQIHSLPAIYDVTKRKLYQGDYVYEFIRSCGLSPNNMLEHPVNQRIDDRNQGEINEFLNIQPHKSKERMERLYQEEREHFNGSIH
jgi:hypothetical protein